MIAIDHVSKSFGKQPVLSDVTLQIDAGERVALVGANGAGKTTLIRCLLGQYVCDGSIRVHDRSPREKRREVLARVGFVPQTPPALRLTVGQLLSFAGSICGSGTGRMEEMASALALDARSVWRRPFNVLSGGQKQKLLIAIALGRDADVQIMDEPAANLDPEGRRSFFELLAARDGQGVMLLSSHRLDEVSGLVNRVVELDAGRVVMDDHVAEAGSLDGWLDCRLRLERAEARVVVALEEWGLESPDGGLSWRGRVSSADRLRFLGVVSRYSGLVRDLSLQAHEDRP